MVLDREEPITQRIDMRKVEAGFTLSPGERQALAHAIGVPPPVPALGDGLVPDQSVPALPEYNQEDS